jgi:UDP-3-O-[3-hydroxymyristoyl] glucosamine N-acyltransferase
MPSANLAELAKLVDGMVIGDSSVIVRNALPIQDSVPGCITLADSTAQLAAARHSPAVAIVVTLADAMADKPLIVVRDLHAAFTKIVQFFRPAAETTPKSLDSPPEVASSAHIDPTASIGRGCMISANVNIGPRCVIGAGCVIHPNVTVMNDCQIGAGSELNPGCVLYPGTAVGERALFHANVVVGAYGFGYRQSSGRHIRTAQLGWVEIGDDCEIGAGTTIDRGTYGPTKIGTGTKIDNQVQIGHNCQIGKHNLICSQVGIAGSCTTGDYVVMGGQVGLADHVNIADRAMIGAQSGLMQDVAAGEVVLGSPAAPRKQKMQEFILIGRLPELRKEVRALQKRLAEMESSFIQRNEAGDSRAA